MRHENVSDAMKAGLIAGGIMLAAQAVLLTAAVLKTRQIVMQVAAALPSSIMSNPRRAMGPRHPPRRHHRLSHK